MSEPCSHLGEVTDVAPIGTVCQDCRRRGDTWIELRACLTCGYVGCSDSSKNQHAMEHFDETGHALVRSLEAGDRWWWCYADRIYFREDPRLRARN